MKVNLIKEPKQSPIELDVPKNCTVEDIYKKNSEGLKYKVLMAKVNNKYERMGHRVSEGATVEFLDTRNQAASLVYQNSLCLIFLKSLKDVMGDRRVIIDNAINQGLYIRPQGFDITEKDVEKVSLRMREIIDEDMPIKVERFYPDEAKEIFIKDGFPEKTELLLEFPKNKMVQMFTLDGYRMFFYSVSVPSTGYIEYFELRKYEEGFLLRYPQMKDPNTIPPFNDETMLFETFNEQQEWDQLLGINYVTELNRTIAKGDYKDLILLSEALHEKRIVEIADMVLKQNKRIVLIAGPSSSGKTTFARRLCIQLRVNGLDPIYMGTDDYFVERENTPVDEYGEYDFENLDAVDTELFNSNMNDLLSGKEVDLPTFNFITGHKEYGERITKMTENQILVIEGIHALNEVLTKKIPKSEKFKVYISPLIQLNIDEHNRIVGTDQRLLRRIVRDFRYRDHDAKATINGWPKVRAGEDKNIFPYSNEADVLFNSVHIYETCVLKKYAEPLLEAVTKDDPEFAEAMRLLRFLRLFKTIDDESAIVSNSILREFIGGSVFV